MEESVKGGKKRKWGENPASPPETIHVFSPIPEPAPERGRQLLPLQFHRFAPDRNPVSTAKESKAPGGRIPAALKHPGGTGFQPDSGNRRRFRQDPQRGRPGDTVGIQFHAAAGKVRQEIPDQ